jgi:PAS domain S-box-containing protein
MPEVGLAHVLVVDDSEFFVELTAETLGKNPNIRTQTAKTGPEALEVVREKSIDCVVSDYEMPGMDGLELYAEIDAEFDIPFILLTGRGGETIASEAIGAGVDDYLTKDDIIEEDQLQLLVNRIQNVVAQHRASRKYQQLVDNTPDEIVEVTTEGTILAANESMARAHGMTQAELIGADLATVLSPGVAEDRLEHGRRAITAGSAVTFQDQIGVRHFHNVVTPLREAADGNTVQFITRDITQQKRHEQQLEERTEELALINRLVRHDINNDVQLLLGWSDAVADHVSEEGREYVDRIRDTCDHIVELTANVGEFVDSRRDGTDVELKPVDLTSVLVNEVTKKQAKFSAAEISIAGDLPTVTVMANEALQSVFGNLLTNAVRHNDTETPTVTVEATVADSTVVVTVADDGPGVADDHKEEIFGKGEMGPESPGTGIGLYLVTTLVDQYHGRVWVEDNEPTGARFMVELPVSDTDA